jgi:hypothetical protein
MLLKTIFARDEPQAGQLVVSDQQAITTSVALQSRVGLGAECPAGPIRLLHGWRGDGVAFLLILVGERLTRTCL